MFFYKPVRRGGHLIQMKKFGSKSDGSISYNRISERGKTTAYNLASPTEIPCVYWKHPTWLYKALEIPYYCDANIIQF